MPGQTILERKIKVLQGELERQVFVMEQKDSIIKALIQGTKAKDSLIADLIDDGLENSRAVIRHLRRIGALEKQVNNNKLPLMERSG